VTYGTVVVSGRCMGGTPKPEMLLEIYQDGSRVAYGTTPAAELIIGQTYTLEYDLTATGIHTYQGRMVLDNPLGSPEWLTEQREHEVGAFNIFLDAMVWGIPYEAYGVNVLEIKERETSGFFGRLEWNESPLKGKAVYSLVNGYYYEPSPSWKETMTDVNGIFPIMMTFPANPRDYEWITYTWISKGVYGNPETIYARLEYIVLLRPLMMLPTLDVVSECGAYPSTSYHSDRCGYEYDRPRGDRWCDGDATYIYNNHSTTWRYDLFKCRLTYNKRTLSAHVTNISKIVVSGYVKSGEVKNVIETHGVQYEGAVQAGGSGYARRYTTWTVNPYTNQPWTREEVNDLISGVALRKGARCTQVYVSVYQ